MTSVIINPKDREEWLRLRETDITASTVGTLFGVSEFSTPFELWAIKSGRVPRDERENGAMMRGRLLEPVAVTVLRQQRPDWKIEHNAENTYYRDPDARLGATPDVIVNAPGRGRGIVQIKSVEPSVFRKKWCAGADEPEVPLWIAMQATVEAHLVGAEWAAVGALVVSHDVQLHLIEVPLVEGVIDAVKAKVAEFWEMVEQGQEPPPDFTRDGAAITKMFVREEAGKSIDLSTDNMIGELIERRHALTAQIKADEKSISEIDAEVKAKLGDAEIAILPDGRRITWKTVQRKGYTVEPTSYRQLKYPTQIKEAQQ